MIDLKWIKWSNTPQSFLFNYQLNLGLRVGTGGPMGDPRDYMLWDSVCAAGQRISREGYLFPAGDSQDTTVHGTNLDFCFVLFCFAE